MCQSGRQHASFGAVSARGHTAPATVHGAAAAGQCRSPCSMASSCAGRAQRTVLPACGPSGGRLAAVACTVAAAVLVLAPVLAAATTRRATAALLLAAPPPRPLCARARANGGRPAPSERQQGTRRRRKEFSKE